MFSLPNNPFKKMKQRVGSNTGFRLESVLHTCTQGRPVKVKRLSFASCLKERCWDRDLPRKSTAESIIYTPLYWIEQGGQKATSDAVGTLNKLQGANVGSHCNASHTSMQETFLPLLPLSQPCSTFPGNDCNAKPQTGLDLYRDDFTEL